MNTQSNNKIKSLNKRQIAVKLADAINLIEGVPVSDFAKELSDKWSNDEITSEEMKTRLINKHKKHI
jgi:phage-related protein